MKELRIYFYGSVGNVPIIVYWLLFVFIFVGGVFLIWRKGLKEGLRVSAVLLLLEWMFLVLGVAVLFRETNAARMFCLVPFSSYLDIADNSYLMEAAAINLLNVMLFVPIGLLLGCGYRNITWKRVILLGVCLSVLIEILQLLFKKGLCEVDDVIHNVVGCILGYGVFRGVALFLQRCHCRQKRVAINHSK